MLRIKRSNWKYSVVFIINTPFALKEKLKLLSGVFIYKVKKKMEKDQHLVVEFSFLNLQESILYKNKVNNSMGLFENK